MKTIPPLHLPHALRLRGTFLAVLAACLAVAIVATHAAPPTVQPLLPGKWPTGPRGGEAHDVKVAGNYAYLALGDAGLAVVDVRNPANCVQVGGCDTSGYAYAVAVSGNYAYVAAFDAGLQVFDVSSPSNCVLVGGYGDTGFAVDVAVSGNHAYLADFFFDLLHVIDVSDPTNCVLVDRCGTSGDARGVAVSGNYAYVAVGNAGLQVIDVRNPTNCVPVGGCDTSGHAVDVTVSENYAYVADSGTGLQVIDVSNPTNCVPVAGYDTSGSANGVVVAGNYAYVADDTNGLQVIDVSNPTNCVRVGGSDTSGTAYGVAVAAERIYVADGEAGLVVLPSLPNVQFTVRVDATPGVQFTIEAATNLACPIRWTCLLVTNVPVMPYDFVDYDVRASEKPQKFYRVRQSSNDLWCTVVFRDEFDGSGSMTDRPGWIVNHPEWSCWWVQGRTFFPNPDCNPAAPFPYVADGKCIIEHHLYNPYHLGTPKTTFLGGEIHTVMEFLPGNAYRFEARLRCNPCPSGLVTAFFTYGYDGWSDEIDFEFLSKQSNDNVRWPLGDPVVANSWNESQQCPQMLMVTNLDLTVWNTFRIYWYPGQRVVWTWLDPSCGERVLRTETRCLPDEAMSLYFNFWAATAAWPDAYDARLQPAQDPSQNQIHTYEIDYVEVRVP